MPTPPSSVAEPRARWGEGLGFFRAVLTVDSDSCIVWPYGTSQGYPEMNIVDADGRRRPVSVHVMVCEAVHGERPPGTEVAHGECHDRRCVNPKHLRWATHNDNCLDRARDGTENVGERNGRHKLTEAEVREIRQLWGSGGYWTQRELGEMFGVGRHAIGKIVKHRRWRHVVA